MLWQRVDIEESDVRDVNVKGQVAVVTGAASGIGLASARALASAGARVVLTDIDGATLDHAYREVARFASDETRAALLDVTDVSAIEDVFSTAHSDFGSLDILINNAGVSRQTTLAGATEDDWNNIMAVNGKGAFFCLQRAARFMVEQGSGSIVNVASVAGRAYVETSNPIYAMSKGALLTLSRLAALKLAPHGVRVNAVCPGTTDTPLNDSLLNARAEAMSVSVEETRRLRDERIPLGFANTADDVASIIVYLASSASRTITGQAVNVDGGLAPI